VCWELAFEALPFAVVFVALVALSSGTSSAGGFIWMIFLDLVGGGGSAKFPFLVPTAAVAAAAADDRLLDLTVSAACMR